MKDFSLIRKQRIEHPQYGKGRIRFYEHLKTGMFIAEIRYCFRFCWIEVTKNQTMLSSDKLVKEIGGEWSSNKLKDLLEKFNNQFELRKIKR